MEKKNEKCLEYQDYLPNDILEYDDNDILKYDDKEKDLLCQIGKLYEEWNDVLLGNKEFMNWLTELKSTYEKEGGRYAEDEYPISWDGFYPGYLSQKYKILFIGREPAGVGSDNYINTCYCSYQDGKFKFEDRNLILAAYHFHRRMLYVVYGLNKNLMKWDDLPDANKIVEEYKNEGSFPGFAFMNLSKISNDSNTRAANWNNIWRFVEASTKNDKKKNFLSEQIRILDPDLIIAMNLEYDRLSKLGDKVEEDYKKAGINSHNLVINNKKYPLLDTYHFSFIPKKNTAFQNESEFIDSILEAARAILEKK